MPFTWIPFYKEFSQKLLRFRNDRRPLVNWVYENIDSSLIKHFKDAQDGRRVPDTDPFTVMAIINRGITWNKKITLCKYFKNFLNISAPVPQDFTGVPEMNNQRSNFIGFEDKRQEGDIERLWNLFECAVLDKDIEEAYDSLNGQFLIKYIITIGLFWIRPDKYLSLDGNNKTQLTALGIAKFNNAFVPYKEYKAIMNLLDAKMKSGEIRCKNYAEFSQISYIQNDGASKRDVPKDSLVNYWIYSPGENASKWQECRENGIMCIGWDKLGDLSEYDSRKEIKLEIKKYYPSNGSAKNDTLCVWQFAKEMKKGDIVYAKKGMSKIIGKGIVESGYIYDRHRNEFKHIRKIKWTHVGEWKAGKQSVMKTLTNITKHKEYIEELNNLLDVKKSESKDKQYWRLTDPVYTDKDFLREVYVDESQLRILKSILKRKKNLILQGAPGVGKTYVAKRLAYAMIGEKDDERVKCIQFHQSYSYEDFVMGYKPNADGGFSLEKGIFYNICQEARLHRDKSYFLIIDEINRGNLSKIFGELLQLIEADYRDIPVHLAYNKQQFSVPGNLYIIGMMNTADRSLAMIDYALRRRFSFYEMTPAFGNAGFKGYIEEKHDSRLDSLVKALVDLNKVIVEDDSLGKGFCIGHSYLCNLTDDYDLQSIVEYDILPMLREYWFDNDVSFDKEAEKLREAVK